MLSYDELRKRKKETGRAVGPQPMEKKETVAKATPSFPSRKTVKLNTAHRGRGGRNDQRMAQLMKRKGEDEKTRLYRTHDKLLNPEERVTKYRLAAADETLDAATRRRAAKRGMKVEGESILGMQPNRKGGFTPKQMKRLQTAEKIQTEYQKQLRGASFAAGLLDSMSGDIKDIAVKASGSKALQKRNAALKEQMEETKAQHKGAALAGAFTGEMAKAGAGYMTIGKAAESMLLRGAGKMTGATAPDAIQKAAARVIFDPKRKKMAQVGLRLLGQQAADTAVNTPITLAAGLAEGKSKEEIGKDIGKQMAVDAAFNLGLEGVGTVGKKLLTARQAAAERKAKQAAEAVEKPKNNLTREKEVAEEIQETFPDMPPAKEKQALPPADGHKMIAEKMETPGAATTQRAETIDAAAETMAQGRNIMEQRLSRKEIRGLEKELHQLENDSYVLEELKRVEAESGGDPAAVRAAKEQMEARKEEITQKLIAQEGKRTPESIQKDTVDELTAIFRVTEEADRESLQKAMTLLGEKRSKKKKKELFELLYKQMGKDSTGSAREILQKVQSQKILVGAEAAADIPDINEWNHQLKGLLGKIKVGKESNVEELYDALHEMAPGYFPANIDKPAEQLEQIRMVAERAQENADLTKAEYRKMFNRTLNQMFDSMDVQKAYAGKVAEQAGQVRSNLLGKVDYGTVSPAEVQEWHREAYRLKQAAESVPNELNATEKQIVEGMLNGDITEEAAKKMTGPAYPLLVQRFQLEQPLRAVEEKITGYKKYAAAKRYEMAQQVIGEMPLRGEGQKGWKDKKIPLAYELETFDRNIYDIAPDKETAERVIQAYYAPIQEAERQRILFVKSILDEVRQLGISTKKNIPIRLPGTSSRTASESGIVHWLGENEFQLQQMKDSGVPEKSYAKLEEEINRIKGALQPEQLERIYNGVDALRSIYERMYPMINTVSIQSGYDPIGYIPGYFPHMNFDDPIDPLGKLAKELGFNLTDRELPMDIAGRTEAFRPGKKWSGNLLKRNGTETDYDALRALDQYLNTVSDVIYHTDNIRNIRALEDHIRYATGDEALRERIRAIRMDKNKKPEEQQEDLDKLYEELKNSHRMQGAAVWLREYGNQLAGKKNHYDRPLEQGLGRAIYNKLNSLSNNIAGNMVAANISSALTNVIPITQGMKASTPRSNMKGLAEALRYVSGKEMDDLTKKSAFLATREGIEPLYKTAIQRMGTAGGKLNPMNWMETVDQFSTQAVWRSRFHENMKKGLGEADAIKEADTYCYHLFGGRSKGAMPNIFSSKLAKPLTMFQLEVNNQLRYLMKDIPREYEGNVRKIVGRWTGIIISAYLYNDLMEQVTGRRSALDPLGIANAYLGDLLGEEVRNTIDIGKDLMQGRGLQLTEEKEKKKPSAATEDALKEISGNIPFVGGVFFDGGRIPMKSAIPHLGKAAGTAFDFRNGEITKEQAIQKLDEEMLTPISYLPPTVGMGQIRKTVKGLNTMQKGGSYNYGNEGPELAYAVDQENKANWVKSALFGKWSTPEAKNSLEKKTEGLGAKHTKAYENMVQAGTKNIVAFEAINRVRQKEKAAEKRQAIRYNNKLTAEQKAILYRDVVLEDDDDKDRLILAYCEKNGDFAEGADCLSRMADNESTLRKRNVLRQAKLSEATKEHILFQKIVDKNEREKEKERLALLKNQGLHIDDYLSIKNKYGELYNNEELKKTEKAAQMSQWIWNQDYNSQQRELIKSLFLFWGSHKIKYPY